MAPHGGEVALPCLLWWAKAAASSNSSLDFFLVISSTEAIRGGSFLVGGIPSSRYGLFRMSPVAAARLAQQLFD